MKKAFLFLLDVFSACVRPMLGPRNVCRFYPTCTQYSRQAVIKYGVFKGSWLSVKRISRCHPLCEGGVDMVP